MDFRDGRVIATIPTRGRGSHMLAMSSAGDRIATGNIADGTISQLDVGRRDTARVIPVGRQPEGLTMTPDGRSVWAGSNRSRATAWSPRPKFRALHHPRGSPCRRTAAGPLSRFRDGTASPRSTSTAEQLYRTRRPGIGRTALRTRRYRTVPDDREPRNHGTAAGFPSESRITSGAIPVARSGASTTLRSPTIRILR